MRILTRPPRGRDTKQQGQRSAHSPPSERGARPSRPLSDSERAPCSTDRGRLGRAGTGGARPQMDLEPRRQS